MNRSYKFVIYIIVAFSVIFFTGVIIKTTIVENLNEKKESLNNTWKNIVEINDRKINYVKENLYKSERDSLLVMNNLNKEVSNDEYTFYLYKINKYLINNELDSKTKKYLIKIDLISNKLIQKYNNDVLAFNKYASSFPVIMIARNKKYKTYNTLPIIFGQPNKDPKESKKETIDWLRGMERNEGL